MKDLYVEEGGVAVKKERTRSGDIGKCIKCNRIERVYGQVHPMGVTEPECVCGCRDLIKMRQEGQR